MSLFSLFGGKNKKTKKKKTVKTSSSSNKTVKSSSVDPQISPEKQALIDEALANARKAKHEIGEENIKKIVKALEQQENSIVEQCKRKIASMPEEKVADGVKSMLRDE